jgi:predicted glycogen debranching enzyme
VFDSLVIDFGREVCGVLDSGQRKEWLVTNGTGSYASGTVSGIPTRGYHGLLISAQQPPVGRTLLVSALNETVTYGGQNYDLGVNRWASGAVSPQGFLHLERFHLIGRVPCWRYALADALIDKTLWIEPGQDVTYVRYQVVRASGPLTLSFRALVNYRSFHGRTQANGWVMQVDSVPSGLRVTAYRGATPFFLLSDKAQATVINQWYSGLELSAEKDRGLADTEDVLCAGSFIIALTAGQETTFAASLFENSPLDGAAAFQRCQAQDQQLLSAWQATGAPLTSAAPDWIRQLVLAADQFIVTRSVGQQTGKSIIAGYHWFNDWGRDTMISIPGLALSVGRPDIAKSILATFARFVSQGMIPNAFPDDGSAPTDSAYNTVDATLWYLQAIKQYVAETNDLTLLGDIFPVLQQIISAHVAGTRFNIHMDPNDGLLYAGQDGVQLTWMDAKVGNWVVTPRIGKPIEVNALWYAGLVAMDGFAQKLGKPRDNYAAMADKALNSFARFWDDALGYCFDVLDGPNSPDTSLRPNQLIALAVTSNLFDAQKQQKIVDLCGRTLLGSYCARTLDPHNPAYQGVYSGPQSQRDNAYHNGAAWAWLLGIFSLAHHSAYGDPALAIQFLSPVGQHLRDAGLGTISEIFDGDEPLTPAGCIAQAWSVGMVLQAWTTLQRALLAAH